MSLVQQKMGIGRTLLLVLLLAVVTGCGGSESRKAKYVEQGKEFMAERNYTKARIEFRNALQIDPKDAEVRALAGLAAERLGEYGDAVKAYRLALSLDPNEAVARAKLARILASAGVLDEASELVAAGLQSTPDSAALLSVRAVIQGQSGDAAAARQDAERAFGLDPNDPDVVVTLATILWRSGERDGAVKALKDAIARTPEELALRFLLTRFLIMLDRFDEAEVHLAEIIRLEPAEIKHRYVLSEVYLYQGKSDRAVAVLRDAVADLPDSRDAKLALANMVASHKSFEEADELLKGYRAAAPRDLDLLLGIAGFYEARGHDERAAGVYTDVIEAGKDRPQAITAKSRLASLELRSGRANEAAQLVTEVLKQNPTDSVALVTRAEIALYRGDPASAVSDLRAAFGSQPESVPIATALAKAHRQAGQTELAEQVLRSLVQTSPGDVEARFALAVFLAENGRIGQAGPVLEQLVADQPDNVLALERLSRLQRVSRDMEAALRTAKTVQTLRPGSSNGFMLAGEAFEAGRKEQEAREAYERAQSIDPKSIGPVLALTRLDVRAGHADKALIRLDEGIARQPDNAVLLVSRGDVLLGIGRPQDAAGSYAAAVKIAPAWAQAHRGLGAALAVAGRHDDAIKALRAGLAATRNSPQVAMDLAMLFENLGRFDDAMATYEDMLARNPNDDGAANNLAMLLADHGQGQAALERALMLAERFRAAEHPALLDTYGWVLFRIGRNDEALVVLASATEKAPESPELRYHLGMAQLKAGQQDEARANLKLAVASDRSFRGIDGARAALATL